MRREKFDDFVKLPPAKLYPDDLKLLGKIVTDGYESETIRSNFSVAQGNVSFEADSVEELLSEDLPTSTKNFSLYVAGWSKEYEKERTIWISLDKNSSSCRIFSSDEVWFRGKTHQIKDFFKNRRPWYGPFKFIITPIFYAVNIILMYVSLDSFVEGRYIVTVISGPSLVFCMMAHWFYLGGRLFPQNTVNFAEKGVWVSTEVLHIGIALSVAIMTLASLVLQISKLNL